jgi:hypothetical protein
VGTSFLERLGSGVSSIGGFLGDVAAGIGGGLVDIGGQVLGGVVQQLPEAILGGLLPQPAPATVFTGTGAPTTRFPGTLIAGGAGFPVDPARLVRGGTFQVANVALPGGAPIGEAGLGTELGIGAIERGFNFLFGGGGGGGAVANGAVQLFRPTATSIRPARVIVVPHPQTGAPIFFGHLGRPLLFSRDLSAARRVDRLARRARRVKRGR